MTVDDGLMCKLPAELKRQPRMIISNQIHVKTKFSKTELFIGKSEEKTLLRTC